MRFLTAVVLSTIGLVGTSCQRAARDESAGIPVRFGIDNGGFAAQVWVAEELGYFEELGIDAELNVYSIGADAVVGLLAGKEDFAVATAFPILAAEQDEHMKIVTTIARPDPGYYQFAAVSDVKDASGLRGKTVGVHQGTNQAYITRRFLENGGVDVSQVELLPFAGQFEIIAAMRAGDVDGAWVWGVGVDQAKAIDGVEILVDDEASGVDQAGFLAASERFLSERPAALELVTRALKMASDYIEASDANLRSAAEIVASKQRAPVDTVLTILAMENYTTGFLPEDRDTLQQLADWQVSAGIRNSADIDGILATSVAESIH